jgi:hypothetical protein
LALEENAWKYALRDGENRLAERADERPDE